MSLYIAALTIMQHIFLHLGYCYTLLFLFLLRLMLARNGVFDFCDDLQTGYLNCFAVKAVLFTSTLSV